MPLLGPRALVPMVVLALSAGALGCSESQSRVRQADAAQIPAGPQISKAAPADVQLNTNAAQIPRASQTIVQAGHTAPAQIGSQPAANKSTIDPAALREFLRYSKELAETDPEAHMQMIEQFEDVDPALFVPLLQTWKAVLARAKREQKEKEKEKEKLAQASFGDPPADEGTKHNSFRPLPVPELNRDTSQESAAATASAPREDSLRGAIDGSAAASAGGVPGRFAVAGDAKAADLPTPETTPPPSEANQATAIPVDVQPGLQRPGDFKPSDKAWDIRLANLIELAEKDAAAGGTMQGDIDRQVYLRLLYLMAGQQEKALLPLVGASSADQEFWKDTLWALGNYFDRSGIPDESDRATQTVLQLTSAADRLREKAQLEVRNLSFCYRINSFGSYERFEQYEFTPGQAVLLYCEVDNFHSEPDPEGYRTVLSSTIEIVDLQGHQVWQQKFPPTEDLCRKRRHDYFHSYNFHVPEQIYAGHYVLKLTVEDQLAGKVAEGSIKFTIK